MTAILTDRAIVAKQIASILEMDLTTENEGYFQGHGFMLVWTDRELVSLSSPKDNGKSYLAGNDLSFIPRTFTLAVRKMTTSRGTVVADKAAVRQLNTIKKVFDACESIIVATDASEAGELTFRHIYSYLRCKKPFRRLWLHSLTTGVLREAFKNLKEGSLFDNLYAVADCRAKADALIDFHASHAFALATGLVNRPLGRLQVPALAILCKRCSEHRKFRPVRFHECRITLEKDGLFQSFALPITLKNRRKAEKIYEHLKGFLSAQTIKVENHSRIQPSPMLYNLIALQRDTNERHGFSAAKTMEIARKLYERRLISYPLTDSLHIPEAVFETIPKILRQTAACCKIANKLEFLDMENPNRRSVGNISALDHHALIPTGVYSGYLPQDEQAVYEMIVRRTLEAFAPDCQKEVLRVEAAVENLVLVSGKSRIITPGWRAIQNREEDREEDEADDNFPAFTEGETVSVSGWNMLTKKTLPPPLYTEAGLLTATKEACLGTAATRAFLIESLLSCGYIERREESLVPTEKGQAVYNCVKDMRMADTGQAGGWEKMLADVGRDKQCAETFMTTFQIFTRQLTEEIRSMNRTKGFAL
jgi:DNA topoisomerase-3